MEAMHTKVTSSHWGAFHVTTDGKRLLSVAPFGADAEPSAISDILPQAVHHASRVGRPAIRRSWLEGQPGQRSDTSRHAFTEVPWDEALDIAAREIERVRDTHGNKSIFGGSYGWSSAGRFHHAQSQLKRFLNCIGGCVSSYGSYSAGASHVVIPHIFGADHHDFTWRWQNSWTDIIGQTETLVAFGGINTKTAQINAGGIGRHQTASYLNRLAERGARIYTVSPQATDGPEGAHWISLAPGTDTALMLGIAFALEEEDLVDRAFLARCTTGYDTFRTYLLGECDGQPKTPKWASEICGVPVHDICELAIRMANSRTMITVSWALQRARYGEQPYWMSATLASMLGHIGRPGGGIGFGYGSVGGIGSPVAPIGGCALPQGQNPVSDFIPVARMADMLLNPGGDYQFNGQDRTYADIRLIYWAGGNPFHHHQDLARLETAWKKPDTIIVNEPYWTATAKRADIVFPATTPYEREDIGREKSDPFLFHMPRLIDPLGEARNDHDIMSGLASRMGVSEQFTEGRTADDWLRHLYGQLENNCRKADVEVPSFDKLRALNWTELKARLRPERGPFSLFREDPDANPLPTPSGRIEIYSETVAGFTYDDCPGHAVWRDPGEFHGAVDEKPYPLHLVSPQPADKLHSQLESALADRPGARPERIEINPVDAMARNIADGDVVRVFNERGACLARARINTEIHPGVVSLPTGTWYDPGESGVDRQGNPNVLTRDIGTSRLAQGCSAHTARVEVAPRNARKDERS
jgi:biotin/methionine sulfoxide reductase